jgi:hypothetical protein
MALMSALLGASLLAAPARFSVRAFFVSRAIFLFLQAVAFTFLSLFSLLHALLCQIPVHLSSM